MRPTHHSRPLIALLFALALGAAACRPVDRQAQVLRERARWEVQLLDWSVTPDGSIHLSTRLAGPATTSIEDLTVRFLLTDVDGNPSRSVWHSFDLREVVRGGPVDRFVRLTEDAAGVHGIGVDRVLQPTPEELERIVELGP